MLVLVQILLLQTVVHTKQIIIIVKGSYCWWMRGSGGNNFQMIIFDINNSLFKFWFRFEFCCFKYVVHTKQIKTFSKDVVIIVIGNCDRRLTDISLIFIRQKSVILQSVLILDADVLWNPSIITLVVQKLDHIYQTWPGV